MEEAKNEGVKVTEVVNVDAKEFWQERKESFVKIK